MQQFSPNLKNYINTQAKPAYAPTNNQVSTPLTNKPAENDTPVKNNYKKLGAALAGLATLGFATLIIAKTIKKGGLDNADINKAKNEAEKALGDTGAKIAEKTKDDIAENAVKITTCQNTQVTQLEKFENTSDEITNWAKKMDAASETISRDNTTCILNPRFKDFEITPHKYTDDTTVYQSIRTPAKDYEPACIENGKMTKVDNFMDYIKNSKDETTQTFFTSGLYSEIGSDGKRYVVFSTFTGRRVGVRPIHQKIILQSKDENFTQAQKDIIKIFKTDKKYLTTRGNVNPLDFATIMPETAAAYDTNLTYLTNKNVLLSTISSWAKQAKDFNADDFINSSNGVIKIGINEYH